jgi:hypothetical protein
MVNCMLLLLLFLKRKRTLYSSSNNIIFTYYIVKIHLIILQANLLCKIIITIKYNFNKISLLLYIKKNYLFNKNKNNLHISICPLFHCYSVILKTLL